MANITINLSAGVIATSNTGTVAAATPLAMILNQFIRAEQGFADLHNSYASAARVGSELTLAYADGASSTLAGVTTLTQSATVTHASATSIESLQPGALRSTSTGLFDFQYGMIDGANRLQIGAASLSGATLATLLPASSPLYDATLGNVTLAYQGQIALAANGDFGGTVSQIKTSADKFILSGTIDGAFSVSGNSVTIGSHSTSTAVSGVATSYIDKYADGSLVSATGLALAVTGASVFDYTVLGNGANFAGADVFDVSLAGALATPLHLASGAGDDQLSIKSGGTAITLDAGSGNDRAMLRDFGMAFDGGSGIDTAEVGGARGGYLVAKAGAGFTLSAGNASNTLNNVERIRFEDVSVALDSAGHGGQAYRIYEAAFNRVPDSAGVGYWISVLDGGRTIQEVATGFVDSAEFKTLYGANPSNQELVKALYQNVLDRAGEQAGIDYWVGVLDSRAAPVSDVLMYFSEGAENQAATITAIGNGFAYTPYG